MGENTQGELETQKSSVGTFEGLNLHVAGSHVAARQQRWLCINKCTIFRHKELPDKGQRFEGSSTIKSRNVVKITFSGQGAWLCVSLAHSVPNLPVSYCSRPISRESSGVPGVWTPTWGMNEFQFSFWSRFYLFLCCFQSWVCFCSRISLCFKFSVLVAFFFSSYFVLSWPKNTQNRTVLQTVSTAFECPFKETVGHR